MLYHLALFVHISGAVLWFIGLGLVWLGLNRLRQAERVEQVCEVSALLAVLERLFALSVVLLLGGGLYMTITTWGFTLAWLDAAPVTLAALPIVGPGVNGRRLTRIRQTALAEPDGPLSASLRAQTTDPVLIFWSRIVALLGWWMVFLMTLKPDLFGTLAALGVAVGLGVFFALLAQRALRKQFPVSAPPGANQEVAQPARR
ncbi:MAG TPA: hypothetical protein VH599_06320 [Ktedonobacterales bacterium]